MKRTIGYLSLSIMLAMPVGATAGAGRGGSGGGGGVRQRSGAGGQSGGCARSSGNLSREQVRAQATDEQRLAYRQCTLQAERVREHADNLRSAAAGSASPDELQRQREALRDQLGSMLERHDRLRQGLDAEQRQAAADRLRKLDQTRDKLRENARALDRACDGTPPERGEIAKQTRKLQSSAEEWQKRYRELGSELGLQSREAGGDDASD